MRVSCSSPLTRCSPRITGQSSEWLCCTTRGLGHSQVALSCLSPPLSPAVSAFKQSLGPVCQSQGRKLSSLPRQHASRVRAASLSSARSPYASCRSSSRSRSQPSAAACTFALSSRTCAQFPARQRNQCWLWFVRKRPPLRKSSSFPFPSFSLRRKTRAFGRGSSLASWVRSSPCSHSQRSQQSPTAFSLFPFSFATPLLCFWLTSGEKEFFLVSSSAQCQCSSSTTRVFALSAFCFLSTS